MAGDRVLPDAGVLALAAAAVAGARAGVAAPGLPVAAVVFVAGLALAAHRPVLLTLAVAVAASTLSARSAAGLHLGSAGRWEGWATVLGDPVPEGAGVRVDLRVEGKHVRATGHGRAGAALERVEAGERVRVAATLRSSSPPVPAWMRARHLAGRATVLEVQARRQAPVPWRVANAFRRVLLRGARRLPPVQRSLFAGFVLGDARGQPAGVADDFRASGLGHLLVVSGQNVAFVLAAAGPLLRRLRLRGRFVAGIAVLALFGTAVRWEPSVLRACAMAALVLYARLLGRPVSSVRVLGLAVTALVLVDPMLAWSAGFGLSVGACLGIALLAERVADRLPGPRWLAGPLSTTLAAQVGTAPLLVGGLGGVPVAAPMANLLALPAAEPVTVWGLVAGLPAGLLGGAWARVLHLPTALFVSWVALVARWTARLPLGALGAVEAGIAATALAVAVRLGDRPVARRWCAIAALATCAVPAGWALSPPRRDGVAVASGATLWRDGGGPAGRSSVLVLGRADGERLLRGLRERGVRSVGVLVVTRSTPAFTRDVAALVSRLRPRLVVAPDRRLVGVVRAPVLVAVGVVRVRAGPFDVRAGPGARPGVVEVVVDGSGPSRAGPPGADVGRDGVDGVDGVDGRDGR